MARTFRWNSRGPGLCLVALVLAIAVNGFVVMRAQTQTQTLTCAGGFTEEVIPLAPAVLMNSLATVPNPVIPNDPVTGRPAIRGDLADYIANLDAAIRLGKAVFWDMQVGSDNRTACATCHFHAGEDARTRNQIHPGPNGQWDRNDFAPDSDLFYGSYPFSPSSPDIDNVTGSQGVRKSTYQGLSKTGVEQIAAVSDPVFSLNGKNLRQVTGRNAPSVINAVFNHRNFHDGRAQAEFNGVNPFGSRDSAARVRYVGPLGPTEIDIHIQDASLASQSVGPVLNPVEMSAAGRTFPEVGHKLMLVKPLGLQKVDPGDSVLGPYAASTTGLTTTYKAMIQAAFKSKWWNTTKAVRIGSKSYTLMEANTSLFFGLSVMLYEATLVSDQTPMDRYLATRAAGPPDPTLLDEVVIQIQAQYQQPITRANLLNGLALFELPPPPAPAPNGVGCMLCHVGAELTSASVRNLQHGIEAADIAFQNAGFDQGMERMFWRIPPVTPGTDQVTLNPLLWTLTGFNTLTPLVPPADVPLAVYDAGYYNIGVRPTADDPGVDAVDPFGIPWSIVRMLQATLPDPSYIKVPGAGLNCGATLVTNSTGFALLSGSLRKGERVGVAGSFKVPSLRNVELTGPYMHNGGKSTLFQVVDFYDDGGNFPNPTLAPLIRPLRLSADQVRDLIAFLLALTDDRVRWQRAPFDHPQLFVPNGDSTPGVDDLIEIPALGAAGGAALPRFLSLNHFNQ
jgi:cytochrome c peroxidase